MFKIQEKDQPDTSAWLVKVDTLISSDGDGDFMFKSEYSAVTTVTLHMENHVLSLVDQSKNYPVMLNNRRMTETTELHHGDVILLGEKEFEILDPKKVMDEINQTKQKQKVWQIQGVGNWLDGQLFEISSKAVIGRDKSCDITIPGGHLSRRHVELIVTGNTLTIKDLESANGTFVNGSRCAESALKNGDEFKIDILTFKVIAPDTSDLPVDQRGTVMADAIKLPIEDDYDEDKALEEKNWVTKPTSIGNMINDSDRILAKHKRDKMIVYSVFGALGLAVIAAGLFIIN